MRSRLFVTLALLGAATSALPAAAAGPQAWKLVRGPDGRAMAQVGTMALTCNRAMPVVAVLLPMVPAPGRSNLTVSVGGNSATVPLRRNGASNVWGGPITDRRVLDLLGGDDGMARVMVDGRGMTIALAGGRQALQSALSGCYQATVAAAAAQAVAEPTDPDERFIRDDLTKVFGYRDGRPVAGRYKDPIGTRTTPRLRALFAACNQAVERADDSKAYDLTGDQGCREFSTFSVDGLHGDEFLFERSWRPTFKRLSADVIEATLTVPRRDWNIDLERALVLRYVRAGSDWLVDDSNDLAATVTKLTADLRKAARTKRKAS